MAKVNIKHLSNQSWWKEIPLRSRLLLYVLAKFYYGANTKYVTVSNRELAKRLGVTTASLISARKALVERNIIRYEKEYTRYILGDSCFIKKANKS